MMAESLLEDDNPANTAAVDFDGNGVHFSESSSASQLIRAPQQASAIPSYLRILGRREAHPRKSSSRSLGEILMFQRRRIYSLRRRLYLERHA